jgi:hypothetical protein
MSEYQYYEFRAVDRSLTTQEMRDLRAISTRADITPTSFVNVYNFGDFRGDPDALVAKYFDAFVYVANWGTHQLMLRFPKNAFSSRELKPFCAGENLRAWSKGGYWILSICEQEVATDSAEDGEGWLDALLPLRAEILRGDYRALYLGWLRAVQSESVDDDQLEPPVPPDLRNLSAPLRSLIEFLDVDSPLLEVAAELSAELEISAASDDGLSRWISSLSEAEKNSVLFQVASGQDPHAIGHLVRRFERERPKMAAGEPRAQRTAGELCAAATLRPGENRRREEERRLLERERRAKEKAAEREKYLDQLETREPDPWGQLDRLIATKQPNNYDRAVTLLSDLRDLAARKDRSTTFQEQLLNLRTRHAGKPSFLRKLSNGGL